MAPPSSGKKISLSVTNWLLGGSLINLEREGNNDKRVSSKVAIKIDAQGTKVYTDGTVKKKEKQAESKPEPKPEVKKAPEKLKETGILKKSKTKGGDEKEEEEVSEKSCCGRCGKNIKSKGDEEKCKKHSGKDESKDDSKEKSKDGSKESKAEPKDKPKGDVKDDKNGKKENKIESKQKAGKDSFNWTDELDKQLQEMFDKKTPWPEILSTIRTNRKNCDQRLEYLEKKGVDNDDAAAIKAKNDATEAALYANVPTTDTNPSFGAGFDAGIFASDFGGDPQNADVKSSWGTPSAAPALNSWGSTGKAEDEKQSAGGWDSTGGDKQQTKVTWDAPKSNEKADKSATGSDWNADSKPEAAWGSHDAATHTVEVPPAQPGWDGDAPAVTESTKVGNSWDAPNPADTKQDKGWGGVSGGSAWEEQKRQEKKDDTINSAEAKTSTGGWNDDNPHVKKPDATNTAAVSNCWGGSDDTAAKENASNSEGWGANSGGVAVGGACDSSGSKSMPGSWSNGDENKSQDKSGNNDSAGSWGNTKKPQEGTSGDSAWDTSSGQSGGNLATSAPTATSWDTAQKSSSEGGNAAPKSSSNGGSSSQSTHTWGGDGANDQKPTQSGWNSGWGNSQGSQFGNGNGNSSTSWGIGDSGSTPQNSTIWGGNSSSDCQRPSAPSATGWNSDNPHVLKSLAPVSGNSGNNQNASNGPNGPPNQGGWGGSSGNNKPSNNFNGSNCPPTQGDLNRGPDNTQQRPLAQDGNNSNSSPPSQNFSDSFQGHGPSNNTANFQDSDSNNTRQNQGVFYKPGDGGTWLFLPNNSKNGSNDPQGSSPTANNGQGGQPNDDSGNNHRQDPSGYNWGPPNQRPPQSKPHTNGKGSCQQGPPQNYNGGQWGQYQNGPSQNCQNPGSQNNGTSNQRNLEQNGPVNNIKGVPDCGNAYSWIQDAKTQTPPQNTYGLQIVNGIGGHWIHNQPVPAQNANERCNQGGYCQSVGPQQSVCQGVSGTYQPASNVLAGTWMNHGPPPPIVEYHGELKLTDSAPQPPNDTFAYNHSPPDNGQAAPPTTSYGNWVWQEANGPQRQTQQGSCGHSHVLNGSYSQPQAASSHCHRTHAAPPQKLNATGRWVWETTQITPPAQNPQPSYTPAPCIHQATYHNPHHKPGPPPRAPNSPQWIGTGMNNPHWQSRSRSQNASTVIPQPQYVSPDPGPKHVHFSPASGSSSFHPSSVGGQDIWSSHPLQPVNNQTPAPSHVPLHSAFGDLNPNGYAYHAPGAFPTSPGPYSKETPTAAPKSNTNSGW